MDADGEAEGEAEGDDDTEAEGDEEGLLEGETTPANNHPRRASSPLAREHCFDRQSLEKPTYWWIATTSSTKHALTRG